MRLGRGQLARESRVARPRTPVSARRELPRSLHSRHRLLPDHRRLGRTGGGGGAQGARHETMRLARLRRVDSLGRGRRGEAKLRGEARRAAWWSRAGPDRREGRAARIRSASSLDLGGGGRDATLIQLRVQPRQRRLQPSLLKAKIHRLIEESTSAAGVRRLPHLLLPRELLQRGLQRHGNALLLLRLLRGRALLLRRLLQHGRALLLLQHRRALLLLRRRRRRRWRFLGRWWWLLHLLWLCDHRLLLDAWSWRRLRMRTLRRRHGGLQRRTGWRWRPQRHCRR